MATVNATTTWTAPKGGTTFTVPLSQPATAGATLVLYGCGGALITAKLGTSAGPAFTKRTEAANLQALSIQDIVAVGGETQISITLNGPENVAVIVYDVSGLGAFIAASNNGTGATPTVGGDWQSAPSSPVTVASGNAVLFGGWEVDTTAAFGALYRWRQMGPLGKLWTQVANQPGANAQFIVAAGIADVTATGRYPANQVNPGEYRATSMWNLSGQAAYAVQAAYANAGATINSAPANPIVAENSLPGTDRNNWFLGTSGTNANIAGYTDKVSYAPGDTVNFRVDSGNGAFRVEIYRLGHYGWEDFGARNVLGNQAGYITGTPVVQPAPAVDGTLGSVSCGWATNATWAVPTNAPPGVYYVLYRSTVTTANVASGHFVVRAASAAGKVAVVLPDITRQAYNCWGATTDRGDLSTGVWSGRSLYRYGIDGATANMAHRAYAVSFDRPYGIQSHQPNTSLLDAEQAVIVFAEAQGYNLTYLSDVDLDGAPTTLTTASLVMMVGHHEYWTAGIYDAVNAAVDAGVNMMFAASNVALWRVRFAAGDTGKRAVICYKDSATVDVGPGWSSTGRDPGGYTGTWRDARTAVAPTNPDVRRENALTGQIFAVNAPSNKQITVPFAQKTLPIWRNASAVQALTSGQVYTTPTAVYGDEGDLPDGSTGQPANMVQLCPTSVSYTNQGANPNGTIYTSAVSGNAGFTLYRRASGALVLHTGAWRGWEGVSRWARSALGGTVANVDANWQQAFLAAMFDLGAAPTTLQSLRPGTDTALTNPATGAPGGGRSGVALAYGLRAPEDGNANLFFA